MTGLPEALDRLVSRCLRKDLVRRAQHASDIKVALEELRDDSTSRALSVQPLAAPHPRRWVAPAVAAIVVLAALGATVRWWPRSAPQAGNSFEPVPLTSLPGSESSPTFNPDATQVAFAWTPAGGRGTGVYVQVVGAAGNPKPITSDGAIHSSPAWSPDGKFVALWHSEADSRRVA